MTLCPLCGQILPTNQDSVFPDDVLKLVVMLNSDPLWKVVMEEGELLAEANGLKWYSFDNKIFVTDK
uniref:Uncharacterized protein n=1 Tax=viral metagenome TaxID=1070528 RepID=A0A6M3L1F3_9ZZZZ